MSEASEKVDLVVIGNLLIDELPGPVIEPGGAALYMALTAAKLGLKEALHSVVGNDYPLQPLVDAGIRLSLKTLNGPGGRTVIKYTPEGRILNHIGPGHELMTPQVEHPFQTRLVLLAPMPWKWQLFHLQKCAHGTAFLDPYPTLNQERWNELETHLSTLRTLLLNREELEIPLSEIPQHVPILLKEGAQGGFCRNTRLRWKPASVEVVDPTGAGDSFMAGVAAGLLQGRTWAECLTQGAEMAGAVIGKVGARALF